MCDSQTLCRIFFSHCENFYGCEILNYNMLYMSNLYVSWRKIIRHIFDCLRELIILLCLILETV